MASWFNRGESVFFQFRNGKSVLNSQCKPRMFKTAEKATLGVNYVDTDDIVEYAEQKHGRWVDRYGGKYANQLYECSECKEKALYKVSVSTLFNEFIVQELSDYCPNCGAKMDKEAPHGEKQ